MIRGAMVVLTVAVLAAAACAPQPGGSQEASMTAQGPTPTAAPASEPATSGLLTIVCAADGGTRFPDGTTVAAQSDGVHLQVDNRAGEDTSLYGLGVDVRDGRSSVVVTPDPGPHQVACWPGSRHEGPEPPTTAVRVTDPNRFWVAAEPQCNGGMLQSSDLDYGAGAKGEPGDPVDLARKMAGEDLRDATFLRGGYPESPAATVVARRGGRTVAAFFFLRTSPGRWLLGRTDQCR